MHPSSETLGKISIFQGLTPAGIELIATIAHEQQHNAGEHIFHEGDIGDKLYLIVSGKVRISKQIPGIGEEALAVLDAGNAFGEMSLIGNFPRSADAIAHSPCTLLWISKPELDNLLFLHKDLAYEVLWNFVRSLSLRLRETNEKMTFLSISGKF